MNPTLRSRPPSQKVVERVADRAGTDTRRLPPLYDAIDPDALDALFSTSLRRPTPKGTVTFRYDGYDVSVASDGSVEVRPPDPSEPS